MSENIFDAIKNWYSNQGISTEQFFHNNSTEIGRDEMLMDFAYRASVIMVKLEIELTSALKQRDEAYAVIKNGAEATTDSLLETYWNEFLASIKKDNDEK